MSRATLKRSKQNEHSAEAHTSLEELLASSIVRQIMKRDGVDPHDIRKLIAAVANAMRSRVNVRMDDHLQKPLEPPADR
jgi:hypothetical protein